MNELEIIRTQLALERAHASAVASACAKALARENKAALTGFREACADYLACVLGWFEARDRRFADLGRAKFADADPARRAIDAALARHGRSREVLEKLLAALAPAPGKVTRTAGDAMADFATFFNEWRTRRDAIEALLATNSRTADWRAIGGIDADSILEERARYARVRAALPEGVELDSPSGS
ncbi:MAG TPA: hypothetical protein VEH54_05605 [Steroidobacteraceae bacterium]|nr:hypothetical protein [Steroidobacteraceae bacterium]